MSHVHDLLPEFVLGSLPRGEHEAVEQHLARCPRCAADLRAAEETLALLATSLPPVAPPPSLRARLLESTQKETLADALARVFDLARETAARVIAQIGGKEGWRPGPMPGMELFDFKAGPRLAGADTGLVKFPPKMRFPRHKHLGQETMLVLQGGFATDDGRRLRPGDELVMETGTSHDMLIDGDGCVAAVSLRVGIDVEGMGPITVKDF